MCFRTAISLNLDQQKSADKKLTKLAESVINVEAVSPASGS